MIANIVGNGLWTAANLAAYIRYRRALRNPRRAQEKILRRFLRRNADSEYGRRYGYARIRTVLDFQRAVPIVTYDDLEPWIEKVRQGQPGVFTTEPVPRSSATARASADVDSGKFPPSPMKARIPDHDSSRFPPFP